MNSAGSDGTAQGDDPDALTGEELEWVDELARSWTEVYKKSATTLVLLRIVDRIGPASVQEISPAYTDATGWSITERGLYRTLKRLADTGALDTAPVSVARTGARRNDFSLTSVGRAYRARLEKALVSGPDGG